MTDRVTGLRNAGIILGLAAIVAFVPRGDDSASFAAKVIGVGFAVLILLLAMRGYQIFRNDIYALGDRWRAVLYGSIGAIVFAMAGRSKLVDTTGGTLLFVALLLAAIAGLYGCWQQHRAYRI